MKKYTLIFLLLIVALAACKKDSSTKPSGTTTTPTPPSSPYYFKFTLDGVNYNYNANFPQYMFSEPNVFGGYQVSVTSIYQSMAIRFTLPYGDTVKESDVMGLKGKTFYYNDTTLNPELEFDKDINNQWYSTDTSNTSYSITISNVTFLKSDTTIGYPVRVYVLTGTCSGVIDEGTSKSVLSNGQFNIVISRQDH